VVSFTPGPLSSRDNHNNRYIQPNNRNYDNNISTIHITNTTCSREYYQRILGATTTHKIMNKPTRNKHPLFKIANDAPVDLPTPPTIRGWWNFGSLLGICLSCTNCNRTISSHTVPPTHRHCIQQSKTYLSRRKLRMITTNTPRKRSLIIFRLHLLAHRAKLILRIVQLHTHVVIRGSNPILNYSNNKTHWTVGWMAPTCEPRE